LAGSRDDGPTQASTAHPAARALPMWPPGLHLRVPAGSRGPLPRVSRRSRSRRERGRVARVLGDHKHGQEGGQQRRHDPRRGSIGEVRRFSVRQAPSPSGGRTRSSLTCPPRYVTRRSCGRASSFITRSLSRDGTPQKSRKFRVTPGSAARAVPSRKPCKQAELKRCDRLIAPRRSPVRVRLAPSPW
jgi:hypothetical protein